MELATANPPDEVMKGIVDQGAEHIAHFLSTCAEVLGLDKEAYRVAAGSLTIKAPYYFEQVVTRLQKRHPRASMVIPRFTPGIGAILIGLDLMGVDWSEELLGRIEASVQIKPE